MVPNKMAMRFIEKRRQPRAKKNLPLKIKDSTFKIITETENISSSGVYCKVDRFIPPLTKLNIILLIPRSLKDNGKSQRIECKGVVVRTEPIKEEAKEKSYNIAIFFEHIENKDSQIISNYVDWHLKGQNN